ncbi:MAG TPA: BON domain-containing protein [Chloroflexota bacterium]|nr:BON domain-containing protein [Chloroflexota bacterium]
MVSAVKSDSDIKSDVVAELKWDSRVDETDIGVEVQDGIVTLTGTVPSYAARIAAQNAAHRVRDVLDVVNHVDVRLPTSTIRTDVDIAADVRRALERDVFVAADRIRTTVSHGELTLEGEVDLLRERDDAWNAVLHINGVTRIVNKLEVRRPELSPYQIRRAIEDALQRQLAREVERIEVLVADGTVTLQGKVRSWPEKRAAIEATRHAPGVSSVVDQLEVAAEG